jgi:hypothetical protein
MNSIPTPTFNMVFISCFTVVPNINYFRPNRRRILGQSLRWSGKSPKSQKIIVRKSLCARLTRYVAVRRNVPYVFTAWQNRFCDHCLQGAWCAASEGGALFRTRKKLVTAAYIVAICLQYAMQYPRFCLTRRHCAHTRYERTDTWRSQNQKEYPN